MRPIDADALIERWVVNGDYENSIYDGAFIIKTIEEAPTIEPRSRGKWIPKNDGRYHCSSCNGKSPGYKWDYCPRCGADMRQKEEEQE